MLGCSGHSWGLLLFSTNTRTFALMQAEGSTCHGCATGPMSMFPSMLGPTPTPHSLRAISVPWMLHGHQARHIKPTHFLAFVETILTHLDSTRATCPTFALQPFEKGNFCKLKSDLESLSPASQSPSSCSVTSLVSFRSL